MSFSAIRREYHRQICQDVVRVRQHEGKELPNFSDITNRASIRIALSILEQLSCEIVFGEQKEQTTGGLFEQINARYIQQCFGLLKHLRPGEWIYSTSGTSIANFAQYKHLGVLDRLVKENRELSTTLGRDYIIRPDIIVARMPVNEDQINQEGSILDENDQLVSALTPFRAVNQGDHPPYAHLHASISCKWTIRSDRSQNTRTEALNLIRNRKGKIPHIVAVTAEPLPTRIATLALGTGDLDCVYHFALNELRMAVESTKNEDQKDILDMMIDGDRLRDISDLPFDLAV